jgi:hypothetical protein
MRCRPSSPNSPFPQPLPCRGAQTSTSLPALLIAIAAERYRLKTDRFPAQLADVTPDYLQAVPLDPFDGQPLRHLIKDGDLLIYSIGLDAKDDGAANPHGNSREPDIVVRLSASKAR